MDLEKVLGRYGLECVQKLVDVQLKRAELALKAYREIGSNGVPKHGEILTADEARAVVLEALGLPADCDQPPATESVPTFEFHYLLLDSSSGKKATIARLQQLRNEAMVIADGEGPSVRGATLDGLATASARLIRLI
jgi:hypothetical protein